MLRPLRRIWGKQPAQPPSTQPDLVAELAIAAEEQSLPAGARDDLIGNLADAVAAVQLSPTQPDSSQATLPTDSQGDLIEHLAVAEPVHQCPPSPATTIWDSPSQQLPHELGAECDPALPLGLVAVEAAPAGEPEAASQESLPAALCPHRAFADCW
eukprot:7700109-Lingulodinium_polyedra.AAC.1